MVKMQESLEGDKDCNIGKLQEILERAEIRHTLEDLGIRTLTFLVICSGRKKLFARKYTHTCTCTHAHTGATLLAHTCIKKKIYIYIYT